jgi:hypothetical protein
MHINERKIVMGIFATGIIGNAKVLCYGSEGGAIQHRLNPAPASSAIGSAKRTSQ